MQTLPAIQLCIPALAPATLIILRKLHLLEAGDVPTSCRYDLATAVLELQG